MSPIRQAEHHLWLVAGNETYGVAESVSLLTREVSRRAPVSVMALQSGSLTQRLSESGQSVVVLDAPIPPVPSGGLVDRACAAFAGLRQGRQATLSSLLALERSGAQPSHVHVIWPTLLPLATAISRSVGARVVWHVHNNVGTYPLQANLRLSAWHLSRANGLALACSRTIATHLGTRFPVAVLPLAADPRRFSPREPDQALRRQLALDPDLPVFGCIARLDPSKGQELLITAAADLPGPVQLLFVGSAPSGPNYEARLRRIAERLGVRSVFVPTTYSPEIYYGALDVAVNARTDVEPFGLSIVEAMLSSRPVLAFALGGPAEILAGGGGLLVAPPATKEGLVGGLRRMLEQRDAWPAIGRLGRDIALSCYTPEVLVNEFNRALDCGSYTEGDA